MKKKALVAVAGLFRLYQALYLTYLYPDYEWDIVVLRYGKDIKSVESVKNISIDSRRFHNVYVSAALTQYAGKACLFFECVKMAVYFIVGQRKKYARSVILKSIDTFNYDLLCVACSYSVLEGAILCFADEIETVVMEEGLDDYTYKKKSNGVVWSIGARLLFKMQYINLLADNNYKPLRFCKKYVRNPDRIRSNNYLEVCKMFELDKIEQEKFETMISRIFKIDGTKFDVIIYTSPLWSYDLEKYYYRFESYITKKYRHKRILLKRHPQDNYKYDFKDVEIVEKYVDVPGELVLRHYKGVECLFMFPSTILFDPEAEDNPYNVIYFTEGNQKYCEVITELIAFLKIDSKRIINL